MKKLVKSGKNSFTLFETLIGIFLLSIIIVGFSKASFYDNFDQEYILLNHLENIFNSSSYDSFFTIKNTQIQLRINEFEIKNVNVKKIEYKDDKVEIFKYEL